MEGVKDNPRDKADYVVDKMCTVHFSRECSRFPEGRALPNVAPRTGRFLTKNGRRG